ncbi:MAG: hypothetical protein J6Z17_02770 [Treponema sp.]|nr:hypothetical protein [Treponema sp.]
MKLFKAEKKLFVLLFTAAVFFNSCTSIQKDMVMSTDSLIQDEDIEKIEMTLSRLDSEHILGLSDAKELKAQCTELLEEIDMTEQRLGMNKVVLSRLCALRGRTYLLMGKNFEAKKQYRLSAEASKGDSQTIILGSRLSLISSLDDENLISGSNQNGLLILEQALVFYTANLFPQCIAKFDEAFMILPAFYAENYGPLRNQAAELKSVQGSEEDEKVLQLLKAPSITMQDAAYVAQETTSVLMPYTGGKNLSKKTLFFVLEKNGLFLPASSIQDTPKKDKLTKEEECTKILSARFFWNLIVHHDENVNKNMYSEFYRTQNLDSPVKDISTDSEDFDAVLGCIEREIINLEDGESFVPEKPVSGFQFSSWLQALKAQ